MNLSIFMLLVVAPTLQGIPTLRGNTDYSINGTSNSSTNISAAVPAQASTPPPSIPNPDSGLNNLILLLLRLNEQAVVLQKTLSTFDLDNNSIPSIRAQTQAITATGDASIAQALALDYLDTHDSTRVTLKTVALKPIFGHLLTIIKDKKILLCEMEYCKEMHDWVGVMRVRALSLCVAVTGIVKIPDGLLIELAWASVDRRFPAILVEFHRPFS
ncbi:hypothetical protein AnigIFM59636_000279 [Aspergillus niger]|uniref:Contig An14c0110, genomic contig n=3 Tax=Aspergillus niger TaxID=5061 RepID=A2R323_ASPNC|nr:uncharacterized protein An14g02770 [Aspergillus niger]RDH25851.1 hypothetical protein M747DRAFT_366094 [Aspergillus niger ATCC 13496]GKZ87150.1 hypothetical protein AnigIFM59636_000279 [Aspergillus niger]CAK46525.1 unnamed protein product [Aspergillus niger]